MRVQGIEFRGGKSYVYLRISPERIRTNQIPGFSERMLQKLPGLKYHQCRNEGECTFSEELRNTEFAHVFEHVLIELIAQEDHSVASVKGWTNWDWQRNPRWTYEIEIYYNNKAVFLMALAKALGIIDDALKIQSAGYNFKADFSVSV